MCTCSRTGGALPSFENRCCENVPRIVVTPGDAEDSCLGEWSWNFAHCIARALPIFRPFPFDTMRCFGAFDAGRICRHRDVAVGAEAQVRDAQQARQAYQYAFRLVLCACLHANRPY